MSEKPRHLFHIRHKKPLGEQTRGKTACNRLRRLDYFLMLYDPSLITSRDDSVVVDLGYGAEPFTTLEMASRFRILNSTLTVVGVEIDADRVERAKPYENEITLFRLGGFDIPFVRNEKARYIRAMNVLRQYEESAVSESHEIMGHYLSPGGLLLEGTSDPFGRVASVNLLRKAQNSYDLTQEGFLFSINLSRGFDLLQLQAVLPKNLIHKMIPGESIFTFFEDWKRSIRETASAKTWGNRQWFVQSAIRLRELGHPVCCRKSLLKKGYLILHSL